MTTVETAKPRIVDPESWIRERTGLLDREKAHTREGDAIAAARRRLPMIEVSATAELMGANGPTPMLDIFEGREQLVVYKHMWHPGRPIEDQCEGCTLSIWHMHDASYLHNRGVSFAVFCEGPWAEVAPFVDFMGYQVPWYSMDGVDDRGVTGGYTNDRGLISCYLRGGDRVFLTNEVGFRGVEAIIASLQLLDLTAYGRQETWEDSPAGWPQDDRAGGVGWWRRDGRPVAQWTRPGVTPVDAAAEHHCH